MATHANDALPLNGRRIVVTRPAGQADALVASITSAGGTAVRFPVLAIQACSDTRHLTAIADRLGTFDLAVFVSPNAVKHALSCLLERHAWPAGLLAATVGKASERELARFGITKVIAPLTRFDSEALLELPELQEMAGKRVVVLRGDGGRELLGDTINKRGAVVEYVTCYQRAKPDLDPAPLLQLWADKQLDGIIVTSSEGLRNLYAMVGPPGQAALATTPLFLPHARIAEQARALGLHCIVPTAPGDGSILSGLIEYFTCSQRESAATSLSNLS